MNACITEHGTLVAHELRAYAARVNASSVAAEGDWMAVARRLGAESLALTEAGKNSAVLRGAATAAALLAGGATTEAARELAATAGLTLDAWEARAATPRPTSKPSTP